MQPSACLVYFITLRGSSSCLSLQQSDLLRSAGFLYHQAQAFVKPATWPDVLVKRHAAADFSEYLPYSRRNWQSPRNIVMFGGINTSRIIDVLAHLIWSVGRISWAPPSDNDWLVDVGIAVVVSSAIHSHRLLLFVLFRLPTQVLNLCLILSVRDGLLVQSSKLALVNGAPRMR